MTRPPAELSDLSTTTIICNAAFDPGHTVPKFKKNETNSRMPANTPRLSFLRRAIRHRVYVALILMGDHTNVEEGGGHLK
ncbi:hypothetical protein PILCRDRAFT_816379 [Piloderma croceum F 1598]|uniref:Uncharacterized protein n=1 Tax=Piloderma croceum (strain F 1598) TaxID=765440 RepID=A0A0C3BJA9_PILCF|nr:hypothetical protein PILCRDRAFT_816379 [Piloderma croceum F 1598]